MSSQVVVLFRDDLSTCEEKRVASQYFSVKRFRSEIPANSLVVGRYSVLPYYRELEKELALTNSKLVNSYSQHSFIADITAWGTVNGVLAGLTPKTYTEWGNLPEGSYVVKGKTNSQKHQWATHMFAPNKAAISNVVQRLLDNPLISEQGLVVREYVPLKQLSVGINGLPITNEWRTFWYVSNNTPVLLSYGFYWASHPEVAFLTSFPRAAIDIAYKAANIISEHANFFVLDLAETANGEWIVIEVNDGQMSGLSMCSDHSTYKSLYTAMAKTNSN